MYGHYNCEGHYVNDRNYNRDNNFNRGNYGNRMIGMGPMSLLKIMKLLLWMVEIVWRKLRKMLHKNMRRFDASDEHIKQLRSDLAGIGQKVDTHVISIK